MPSKNRLRGAQLEADLARRGIGAFRPSLPANALQTLRLYREPIELRGVFGQCTWQRIAVELVAGQRIIRRKDTVLQREVQTRRRLART